MKYEEIAAKEISEWYYQTIGDHHLNAAQQAEIAEIIAKASFENPLCKCGRETTTGSTTEELCNLCGRISVEEEEAFSSGRKVTTAKELIECHPGVTPLSGRAYRRNVKASTPPRNQ